MTSLSSLPSGRLLGVLDIETAQDPAAAAIAGHADRDLKNALLRVTTACLLTMREEEDGRWSGARLESFTDEDEFDLLMGLQAGLAQLRWQNGVLVTYNGSRHDLIVLRRRAEHHWMFGLPGLMGLSEMEHHDMMWRMARSWVDKPPSLRDACAALGIPIDPGTARRSAPTPLAKCQSDVCGTLLLMLYGMAWERGSREPLVRGWATLRDLIQGTPGLTHLSQIVRHPKLDVALGRDRALGKEA